MRCWGQRRPLRCICRACRGLGDVRISLFACTEPVSAAVIASLWLGAQIAWIDWLAIGLILAMAVLAALPGRGRQSTEC